MQRPSRARLPRWPRPDRPALLHQFGGLEAAAEIVSAPSSARHAWACRLRVALLVGVIAAPDSISCSHRHCERSEAIHIAARRKLDCFASLAMTRREFRILNSQRSAFPRHDLPELCRI